MKFCERLTIVFLSFIVFFLYLKLLTQNYRNESCGGYSPSPKPCPNNGKEIKIIILIKSAPKNIERRKSIRETWANVERLPNPVRVAFVLGVRKNFLYAVMQESKTYGDIILGFFIDTYQNLTLKGFHTFSWLNFFCRQVPYVLYCDDDVYVNVSSLVTYLDQRGPTRNTIFGYVYVNTPPSRNVRSKHYVTKEEYPASVYPNYTIGAGYVLTGDLITKLYYSAAMSKLFRIDDIFFTGLLARSLNIRVLHVPEFCRNYDYGECIIRSTDNQPSKQYEFHSMN